MELGRKETPAYSKLYIRKKKQSQKNPVKVGVRETGNKPSL